MSAWWRKRVGSGGRGGRKLFWECEKSEILNKTLW
jgi:hypothetical protein